MKIDKTVEDIKSSNADIIKVMSGGGVFSGKQNV